MLELFSSVTSGTASLGGFLLCTAVSLLLGGLIAFTYTRRTQYTQSFVLTLILLPALVQVVIMLVNGNVGTGVAVAGAFSLVRFRSVPGNARDIAVIFMSMAVGLATGTGYIGVAAVFTVLLCAVLLALMCLRVGAPRVTEKELKITIPESLDYTSVFDDLLAEYTASAQLVEVKTSSMGSLYKLHYHISLKDAAREKEFLDKLRVRNGNLEISCGRIAASGQL